MQKLYDLCVKDYSEYPEHVWGWHGMRRVWHVMEGKVMIQPNPPIDHFAEYISFYTKNLRVHFIQDCVLHQFCWRNLYRKDLELNCIEVEWLYVEGLKTWFLTQLLVGEPHMRPHAKLFMQFYEEK